MPPPADTPPCLPPADPLRDALAEMVGLGVRIARVAAAVVEAEGRVVAVVMGSLPAGLDAGSLAETQAAGQAVDGAELALAQASPRIAGAAQAFERVSRAVRRTVALARRLDTGWPRRAAADDRAAMARRQVARSVGERIARRAQGEAAERLFADLAERLDLLEAEGGLALPAEMVVAAICRDLGLDDPARPHPADSPDAVPDG